jgi:antagonist of KipI
VSRAAHIREAGDSALLLELEAVIDRAVNARVIAIAAAARREVIAGVRDVVSTFRSVVVYFDPLVADVERIRHTLEEAVGATSDVVNGRRIEVPVVYGGEFGPDLEEVAAFGGLTASQVIERHAAAEYSVFMLGFLPGFAYMGTVAPEIAAPRRAIPRSRVAGGSVGIAGAQTAIYPRDSPGGWQIIGRTRLPIFDPEQTPAAMFTAGDSVRFTPVSSADVATASRRPEDANAGPGPDATVQGGRFITVVRPGLFTTVQDRGRWGHQGSGVPVSGALDLASHRIANAIVGNEPGAATLEATLVGPELRIDHDATVAIAGADLGPTLDGAPVPLNRAARCRGGAILRFGERRTGARAYVAVDGGIQVPLVLGSRSTHVISAMGGLAGRALAAGDRIAIGSATQGGTARRVQPAYQGGHGGARLRVLRGPQDDFFTEAAFETLQRSRYVVSPQSDRMGYRLHGARIPRAADREMISDATFTGAIQVPASGDPILLMADRQTTGGYPQIAIVITADLPLAAQLAPGDWIEFAVCSRREALSALVAQEGSLLALG